MLRVKIVYRICMKGLDKREKYINSKGLKIESTLYKKYVGTHLSVNLHRYDE